MKVFMVTCPACGAQYNGKIVRGLMACEYCGTRFALEEDELAAAGLNDVGAEEYDEDSEEYAEDFWESVQDLCADFLSGISDDSFDITDKIIRGLGIDEQEEDIYLIHDDTLFKSGKDGFALTSYGLYCRDMGDFEAHVVLWGDFAESRKPAINESKIVVDGVEVVYYTGNSNVMARLLDLYRDLHKLAKNYDWDEG